MARFKRIEGLNIKLLKTNDEEIDLDDFWNDMEGNRKLVGGKSNTMTVSYRNAKDGLYGDKVAEQCDSATSLANSEVTLVGKNDHGDTIRGANDDFKLTQEANRDALLSNVIGATPQLVGRFHGLVLAGVIKLPKLLDKTSLAIKGVFSRRGK